MKGRLEASFMGKRNVGGTMLALALSNVKSYDVATSKLQALSEDPIEIKTVNILGISGFYHDSAAAIIQNDQIIAAAQEERFTRIKHDESFPTNAVEYCLSEANISLNAVDHIVFYEKPFLKFDRLLETYLAFAPSGFGSFVKAMPQWLKQKLHLPREIRKGLPGEWKKNLAFTSHQSLMQLVLFS